MNGELIVKVSDLRHTFTTWRREAGTPTHDLQRLGGRNPWSSVMRMLRRTAYMSQLVG